jgi:signal transduction histidine kinase/DNA-binding NarL/FixJ family response regulator/HPt (histidine-containing phosphotransfer) domain-containing protein
MESPTLGALPLRILLRFTSAPCERRFVDHYVAVYFRYAQASLVLGVLLVFGDYLVDYFAANDVRANLLRLELSLPVLAAGLIYSLTSAARRHWQPAMAGFIVVMAYSLFWILLLIDDEGGRGLKTWVGILNFTFLEFYCFVILGVQFRYALVSGALILVAFEAAMCAHAGLSTGEVAYWSYHVVTLFILSAGIGWWREYLLRREFSARTALEEARESAEHLARIKGDFLATMSHEIRTPMNGVLGMNELLIDSELLPQQRAWAEGVQASGRHLLGVINDILDFSKADSGQLALESVEFTLVGMVGQTVAMFAQPAAAKGLALTAQFGAQAEALSVRGDPFRLRQIIANLISNAIKFTAAGEVSVRVSVVAQTEAEVELCICVQDTGVGIAPQAQARIFEHFGQADGSTSRDYGGTGLGLAIAKRLIELMGGGIRVESAPDRGAKFYVELRLPRVSGGYRPVAPLEHERTATRLRGHLLLVENNAINQRVATAMIERIGPSVCLAINGADAVEKICEQAFDLVLMDCQMPVMGGLEATRRIRAWEAMQAHGRRAVPIIALTANAMAGDREACVAAGMSDYLTKPFTGAALAEILGRYLEAADPATAVISAASRPIAPAVSAVPAAQGRQPVFDASVLAALPMVADGSQPEFAFSVLEQFVRDSVAMVERCSEADASADPDGVLHGVHTLKSTSAQIGALALAAWAGELESQLRAGHRPGDDDWLRLLAEHRRARLAITTYVAHARGRACT